LVVETADRFTREDSERYAWTKAEFEKRYELVLWFADLPLEEQGTMSGRLMASMKADPGHEWVKEHARRVKSGLETARKELSDEERALMLELHAEGLGVRRFTHRINEKRGVLELADPEARRRQWVSYWLVHDRLQSALENEDR
jgi:hypothetical protein